MCFRNLSDQMGYAIGKPRARHDQEAVFCNHLVLIKFVYYNNLYKDYDRCIHIQSNGLIVKSVEKLIDEI